MAEHEDEGVQVSGVLASLAREADRMEWLLTGRDRH